jgi:hypothetical protein
VTGRLDAIAPMIERLRLRTDNPFMTVAYHSFGVAVALIREDLDAANEALRGAESGGVDPINLRALQVAVAAREGRHEDVMRLMPTFEEATRLLPGNALVAAEAAVRAGNRDRAMQMLRRHLEGDFGMTILRLQPGLHPLLTHERFAPPRWDKTLIWPLEAPMVPPSIHAVFRAVHIQSGRADASDSLPR